MTDITRRGFLASGEIATGLSAHALESADITWVSDDPYLSGNFAPVGRELDAADLPVIAGRIPPDLSGAYMRNGPNPLFKPISFTYPMDGDGMIHAIYLDNGRARYRNRFVATTSLAVERRAGRAVYGGLAHVVRVDPALVRPGENPGPVKNGAFVSVLRHGGHLLALDEAQHCYEMTMELDTLGEWKAGTDRPIRLGAHNRRHPQSGALFALAYSVSAPVVEFHRIDASGRLVRSFPVALAAPTMIHDFVLTERHIVLLAGPAVFDLKAAAGEPPLQWKPDLGMRIGVLGTRRQRSALARGRSVLRVPLRQRLRARRRDRGDYVRARPASAWLRGWPARAAGAAPVAHRSRQPQISDAQVLDLAVEFPRCNDMLEARPTRFVYLPTLTGTLRQQNSPSDTFNCMLKVDTRDRHRGAARFRQPHRRRGGLRPARHACRGRRIPGDFTFNPEDRASDFVLLDAAEVDAAPVAVVRLPQRVPQGLHGTWIAKG